MDLSCNYPYIEEVIGNVAKVLKFSNWNFSLENFGSIGQNYFGLLIPVVLNGRKEGTDACARLVLKLAPSDERYRVSGAVTLMFAREIFLYSTLLDQYRRQQIFASDLVIPDCYYINSEYCKEAIVMKNMLADGYEPYTQSMFLDLAHISVSLISLARFHAHSFILRRKNERLYAKARTVCLPLNLKTNKRYMDVMEDRLNKAIDKFQNTEYAAVFQNLKQKQVEIIEATSCSVNDTCICHGDIWKENILFKYDNKEPISACLIDFQTARVGSPAYDVLYLITSSTDSALRRSHYPKLIDLYYKEFDKLLKLSDLEGKPGATDKLADEGCKSHTAKDLKNKPENANIALAAGSESEKGNEVLLNEVDHVKDEDVKVAGFGNENKANEEEKSKYEVYSQEALKEDLKTVAPACVIVANTALWLANGLQKEGHVRSKIVLKTEEDERAAVDKYKTIMKNIIDDFTSYGYLTTNSD